MSNFSFSASVPCREPSKTAEYFKKKYRIGSPIELTSIVVSIVAALLLFCGVVLCLVGAPLRSWYTIKVDLGMPGDSDETAKGDDLSTTGDVRFGLLSFCRNGACASSIPFDVLSDWEEFIRSLRPATAPGPVSDTPQTTANSGLVGMQRNCSRSVGDISRRFRGVAVGIIIGIIAGTLSFLGYLLLATNLFSIRAYLNENAGQNLFFNPHSRQGVAGDTVELGNSTFAGGSKSIRPNSGAKTVGNAVPQSTSRPALSHVAHHRVGCSEEPPQPGQEAHPSERPESHVKLSEEGREGPECASNSPETGKNAVPLPSGSRTLCPKDHQKESSDGRSASSQVDGKEPLLPDIKPLDELGAACGPMENVNDAQARKEPNHSTIVRGQSLNGSHLSRHAAIRTTPISRNTVEVMKLKVLNIPLLFTIGLSLSIVSVICLAIGLGFHVHTFQGYLFCGDSVCSAMLHVTESGFDCAYGTGFVLAIVGVCCIGFGGLVLPMVLTILLSGRLTSAMHLLVLHQTERHVEIHELLNIQDIQRSIVAEKISAHGHSRCGSDSFLRPSSNCSFTPPLLGSGDPSVTAVPIAQIPSATCMEAPQPQCTEGAAQQNQV